MPAPLFDFQRQTRHRSITRWGIPLKRFAAQLCLAISLIGRRDSAAAENSPATTSELGRSRAGVVRPRGKEHNLGKAYIASRESRHDQQNSNLVNRWAREPDWVIRSARPGSWPTVDFQNLARISLITLIESKYKNESDLLPGPVALYTRSGSHETFLALDGFPKTDVCNSAVEYTDIDTLWVLSSNHLTYDDDPATGLIPTATRDTGRVSLRRYHLTLEPRGETLGASTVPVQTMLTSMTAFKLGFSAAEDNTPSLRFIRMIDGSLLGAWPDMNAQRDILVKLIQITAQGSVTPLPDLVFPQSSYVLAGNTSDLVALDMMELPAELAAKTGQVLIGLGSKYHFQLDAAVLQVRQGSYVVIKKTDRLLDSSAFAFNAAGTSITMNETKQISFAYHPDLNKIMLIQTWRFGIRVFQLNDSLVGTELNSVAVDDPNLERFSVSKRGVHAPLKLYVSFGTRNSDLTRSSYTMDFGNHGESRSVSNVSGFLLRYNYTTTLGPTYSLYSNAFNHVGLVENAVPIQDPETGRFVDSFPIRDKTFTSSWRTFCGRNPEQIKIQSRTYRCN